MERPHSTFPGRGAEEDRHLADYSRCSSPLPGITSQCRISLGHVATQRANISQAKSEGYKRSRNTRVFAVAVSNDESGDNALEWLMSELVEDGDEVVAIRVIELDEGGE
jgi:hypothetical protein